MRTNIDINNDLLKSAMELTNIKTKKGVVEFALKEVIKLHNRKKILGCKGKMEWVGSLDEMRENK